MPKLYDVVHPAGTYTDPNSGQEKTRWQNCGAVIKTQRGRVALKLDNIPVNPTANQDGQPGLWFQLMEPRAAGGAPAPAPSPEPVPAPAPTPAPDDDVPF